MSKIPFGLEEDELYWYIIHKLTKCKEDEITSIEFFKNFLDNWDEESIQMHLDYLRYHDHPYIEKYGFEYTIAKKGSEFYKDGYNRFFHSVQNKINKAPKRKREVQEPKPQKSIFDYKPYDNTRSTLPEASLKPIDEIFFDPEVTEALISEGAKGKGQTGEGGVLVTRLPRKKETKRITGNKITIQQFATVHYEIINTVYFFEREALRATRNAIAKCIGISNNDYYRQATADLIESDFVGLDDKNLLSCTKNGIVYILDYSEEFTRYELEKALEGQTSSKSHINKVSGKVLGPPPEEGQTLTKQIPTPIMERLTPEGIKFLSEYWNNLHKISVTMPFVQPRPPEEILKKFLGAYEIPLNNWSSYRKTEDYFYYEITTKSVKVYSHITVYKNSPDKCAHFVLSLLGEQIQKIEREINKAIHNAKKTKHWRNKKIPYFKIKCCNFEHDNLEPIARIQYHQSYPLHPAAIIATELPRGLEAASKINTPDFTIDCSEHYIPGIGKQRIPEVEIHCNNNFHETEIKMKSMKEYNLDIANNPDLPKPSEVNNNLNNQIQNQVLSTKVTENINNSLATLQDNLSSIIKVQNHTLKLEEDLFNRYGAQFSGSIRLQQRMEMNTANISQTLEMLRGLIQNVNTIALAQARPKKKIKKKRKLKQKPISKWQRFKNIFKVKRWKKHRSGSRWTTTNY